MSKGMALVGIIIIGVLTLFVVNIVQNYQTGNELDNYLLEETTEAAMIDAVDLGYYRSSNGVLRMDREKFVESFVRRFAENVNRDRNYKTRILDLNETPPKVSVQIGSNTVATFAGEDFDIVNKIDAILETKYEEDRLLKNVNE